MDIKWSSWLYVLAVHVNVDVTMNFSFYLENWYVVALKNFNTLFGPVLHEECYLKWIH